MLEARCITKLHNGGRGIRNVSFKAGCGEIAAFVGPNGAGKTTLFRCLAGVIDDYSGEAALNGLDLSSQASFGKIGWLDEKPFAFLQMTPVQFAMYVREMKGMQTDETEIFEILKSFALFSAKDRKMKSFSNVMLRKAAAAPVFMGRPELLLLDEPATGMDASGLIALKKLMIKARDRNATVLISSHILDFVDKLADTVFFIKDGGICDRRTRGPELNNLYVRLYQR
jgi:ABC-type multidrug transport system ATPase subunit